MLYTDCFKENAFRFAAFSAALVALGFDYQSIAHNENDSSHKNFDIANAIGPFIGIFNIAGRMLDNKACENKRKNNIAGGIVIFMLSVQTAFSVVSFTTELTQPLVLPLLIGSVCSLFYAGVNWEPHAIDAEDKSCKTLVKNNAGRIGSMVFSAGALGLSLSSVFTNIRALFLATGAALGGAAVCDSGSRAYDIIEIHKNETNRINKGAALLCFLTMFVNAVASAFGTAGFWNQPTDFSSAMVRLGLAFNIISQCTPPHKNEAQLLLPLQSHV